MTTRVRYSISVTGSTVYTNRRSSDVTIFGSSTDYSDRTNTILICCDIHALWTFCIHSFRLL